MAYDTTGAGWGPDTMRGSGTIGVDAIEDVSEELWDEIVDANLKSAYLCSRAVVPHMKIRRQGSIVTFSSMSAKGAFGGSARRRCVCRMREPRLGLSVSHPSSPRIWDHTDCAPGVCGLGCGGEVCMVREEEEFITLQAEWWSSLGPRRGITLSSDVRW